MRRWVADNVAYKVLRFFEILKFALAVTPKRHCWCVIYVCIMKVNQYQQQQRLDNPTSWFMIYPPLLIVNTAIPCLATLFKYNTNNSIHCHFNNKFKLSVVVLCPQSTFSTHPKPFHGERYRSWCLYPIVHNYSGNIWLVFLPYMFILLAQNLRLVKAVRLENGIPTKGTGATCCYNLTLNRILTILASGYKAA